VDGLMMFSCEGIQGMDLREISFGHVLDVGGDHRLFLGCSLSGYKDSMQGLSGLGVCVFASKGFGLWQSPLRRCSRAPPPARPHGALSCSCTARCLVEHAAGSCVGSVVLLLLPPNVKCLLLHCSSRRS
jgi:hypothetical protein